MSFLMNGLVATGMGLCFVADRVTGFNLPLPAVFHDRAENFGGSPPRKNNYFFAVKPHRRPGIPDEIDFGFPVFIKLKLGRPNGESLKTANTSDFIPLPHQSVESCRLRLPAETGAYSPTGRHLQRSEDRRSSRSIIP